MDEGVLGSYAVFFNSPAGVDLFERLKSTEATYMMQGMKATNIESKGIAMAKMETVYAIRTMLDDLKQTKPKPVKAASSQPIRSVGSE